MKMSESCFVELLLALHSGGHSSGYAVEQGKYKEIEGLKDTMSP
jgi:hypothetical protein